MSTVNPPKKSKLSLTEVAREHRIEELIHLSEHKLTETAHEAKGDLLRSVFGIKSTVAERIRKIGKDTKTDDAFEQKAMQVITFAQQSLKDKIKVEEKKEGGEKKHEEKKKGGIKHEKNEEHDKKHGETILPHQPEKPAQANIGQGRPDFIPPAVPPLKDFTSTAHSDPSSTKQGRPDFLRPIAGAAAPILMSESMSENSTMDVSTVAASGTGRGADVIGNPRSDPPPRIGGDQGDARQPQQQPGGGGSGHPPRGNSLRNRILRNFRRKKERDTEKKLLTIFTRRIFLPVFTSVWFWIFVGVLVLIIIIFAMVFGFKDTQCDTTNETMTLTIDGPKDAKVGDSLTYTIKVTDTVPSSEVVMTATIPPGMSTTPADIKSSWTNMTLGGQTIRWNASANLPPNSLNPPNFTFTVTLKATLRNSNPVLVVTADPARLGSGGPVATGSAIPAPCSDQNSGGGSANESYTPPAAANSCNSKYASYIARNWLLPKNFGDPQCNFTKDLLHDLLVKQENGNTTFVNLWFVTIIPGESGFNPNAWAAPRGVQARIDNRGAWGFYQMGSSVPAGQDPSKPGKNGVLDRGDVNWELQTLNAINYNHTRLNCSFRYWSTARSKWGAYKC